MSTKPESLFFPFMAPIYDAAERHFETLLRVTAGGFLIPHGAQKLFGSFGGYGLEGTGQFFANQLGFSNGYLAALGAGSVEFFGGIMLALGIFTRFSAGAIIVMMLVATSFHLGAGFFWNTGGYEYPLFWTIVALYFWAKGGNEMSVDHYLKKTF